MVASSTLPVIKIFPSKSHLTNAYLPSNDAELLPIRLTHLISVLYLSDIPFLTIKIASFVPSPIKYVPKSLEFVSPTIYKFVSKVSALI